MARITAGVTTSHVPAIGAALDRGEDKSDYWAPVFEGYEWSKKWIAEEQPDVVVLIYNDHATAFSLEMHSHLRHWLRGRVPDRRRRIRASTGAHGHRTPRTRVPPRPVAHPRRVRHDR